MKKIFNITLFIVIFLFVNSCAITGDRDTVIYGRDDRRDWHVISNRDILKNAESVASMWNKSNIVRGERSSNLKTLPFRVARNLCSGEPFMDQPVGAFCTAFLVSKDIMVTAGHCVNESNFKEKAFVFGFRMINARESATVIPTKDIYTIKNIIARKLTRTGADYAVVRLNRSVRDRSPLAVSKKKVISGERLYLLGHPAGLPLKIAGNAKVVSNWHSAYFGANLDSYGGNSGSPVFNGNHEVVGILVRGATDFVKYGDCYKSVILPESRVGVRGEAATRATVFLKYISQ